MPAFEVGRVRLGTRLMLHDHGYESVWWQFAIPICVGLSEYAVDTTAGRRC